MSRFHLLLAACWAAPAFAQPRLEPLDPKCIPPDAVSWVVVRPAPLLERPELKQAVDLLKPLYPVAKGLDPAQLTECAWFAFHDFGGLKGEAEVVRLRGLDAKAFGACFDQQPGDAITLGGRPAKFDGAKGIVLDGAAAWRGKRDAVLAAMKPPARDAAWADLLGGQRAPVAFGIDMKAYVAAHPAAASAVAPQAALDAAYRAAEALLGAANVEGDEIVVEAIASFADAAAAERLAAAAVGFQGFLTETLARAPKAAFRDVVPPGVDSDKTHDAMSAALASFKAKADGNQTTMSLRMPLAVAEIAARWMAGAERQASLDNLETIGLALLLYHDRHGTFPAVRWKGPDGKAKHAHSWRVAILPYTVFHNGLYAEYRLDEPWDSDSNKKVMAKMPELFRAPGDDDAKENHWSNYFALVGDGAAWEEDRGAGLPMFTDGTANTVLAVEAKRKIPWNKPEDIAYEKAGDLPKLGALNPGGWNALFADGSVKFISAKVDEKAWRALITRAGGEVVP